LSGLKDPPLAAFCNAAEFFTQIANTLPDDYKPPPRRWA
jgi:hypothetical protein